MLRILLTTLIWCSAAYALEPEQLLRKTSPSMVMVRALSDDERLIRAGGGIVIDRGKVVTNCHLLAKAKSLQVQYQDIIYRSTLEHADIELDLCQLEVSKLPAPAMTVGGVQTVRLGQPVHALTMLRTGEPSLVDSRVLALREFQSVPIVEISTNLLQRAGAAAIVDDDGRLIGITALMVKDTPDTTIAIFTDALKEIPQRAQQALERQRTSALAKTPSGAITSYAAEWAPRIALLEKSQGELTLSKAIAILLDISAQEGLDLVLTHEEKIKTMSWQSAYAIGTDHHGNIIWGGSRDWRNLAFAIDTATEYCAGTIASSCKVIMANGKFREKDFIDVAKQLGAQNVAATRQAYLQSLAQLPTESRVRYNAGGGGGGPSYGFASAR